MKRFNIAIDGPSGAGKSTISKLLAKKLNMIHLDTGAMYRCLALKALQLGLNAENEEMLCNCLAHLTITLQDEKVMMDGKDVSNEIRMKNVSDMASLVSRWPKVRQEMVARQKQICHKKGFILDGRDIGTVVLPDAKLKIFLVASIEARSLRRYEQDRLKDPNLSLNEVKKAMLKRDRQDETRAASPLRQAADAIRIDCSNLTIDEVVATICAHL